MTNLSKAEEDAIAQLLSRTEDLIKLKKFDDAEIFLAEIEKYKPNEINVPFQRGMISLLTGENEKALEQFLQVHERKPRLFDNLNNIAASYSKLNKYDEAIDYYKKCLSIKPDTDYILSGIASCFFRQGNLEKSMENFRRGIELSPHELQMHSNYLLVMIYAESVSAEQVTEEAKRFGKKVAKMFPENKEFYNDKTKDRKLRIGYVSPDFRDHPVPYFLDPVLRRHDREKFEIYAYSNTIYENPVMERMKAHVDVWHDIYGFDVKKITDIIMQDQIDILIDVAGHTGHNSLDVFAGRAAPVQATWLGYPATTGVPAMDYRITDSYAEPAGTTEYLSTETLWRLPHIFCAYSPHEKCPEVIDHPPFEDNGYITFGCFNNFNKVRDPVLAAWSKILEKIPDSRLLIEIAGIEDAKFMNKVHERFRRHRISLDRVVFEPWKKENQFVLYNKIDISLDPFPCAGGTTSMDTLWMGVPFVTLAGKTFVSRMGVTILSNAGLPELIAQNVEEYISIAVNLAADKNRLKNLRHNLRERFAKSPAMDHAAFTSDMEQAYRGMWHKYCDSSDDTDGMSHTFCSTRQSSA